MNPIIGVFADGGCIARNPSPIGGTWAWCAVDTAGQRVLCQSGVHVQPGGGVTNNEMEYFALVDALATLADHAPGWSGPVHSDSQVSIGRIFWGWRLTGIPDAWQTRLASALGRLGTLTPVLLDGHPTRAQLATGIGKRGHPVSPWNVWCDRACREAGERYLTAARPREQASVR